VQSRRCQAAIAVAPGWRSRFPELLFKARDAVAGSRELGGLRERLGDVVAGVGGFGGELVDLGLGARSKGFEAAEAVLQADDQLAWIGASDLGGGHANVGAGGAVEGQDDVDGAQDAFDGDGDGEAAEFAGSFLEPSVAGY